MAQPESRLRAPDRLDRGAAQVSAARLGRGPPSLGSGKTRDRRGALTWRPEFRPSAEPKVSRGWSKWSGCRGSKEGETRGFPSSHLLPCPLSSANPEGVLFFFLMFYFMDKYAGF